MSNKTGFRWSNVILVVLSFIVIVGLLANLFNYISSGSGSFTFKHFLDIINSFESITPNFTLNDFVIKSDWGIFNFLRNTFEFFGNVFTLIGFLAINLLNLLKFVLHFVTGLFFL